MQRLGFLYFVCKNAPKSRSTTRDALATKLLQDVQRLETIPGERSASMHFYIERLKTSGSRNWYSKAKIAENVAQYQDLLLDDPALPSSTGRVTSEVAVDFVDEAVEWGLVRDANYTLTDRGSALLYLWKAVPEEQPLLLSPALRHACTFWYLDVDGDALRAIYQRLPPDPKTVNREEVGLMIGDAIGDVLEQDRKLGGLGRTDRQRFVKLRKAITDSKGDSSGSGRAIYQQGTMRGEHPADLGLVIKPDRFRYHYRVPALTPLRQIGRDVGKFLEYDFAATYSRWLFGKSRVSEDVDIWPFFYESYNALKNALGYASYNDAALLTQVAAASENRWVEVATIKARVSEPGGRYRTRLGLGRSGRPEYVKVDYA